MSPTSSNTAASPVNPAAEAQRQATMSLRVAAVWGTTVLEMRTLTRGQSFWLGETPGCVLPMPDGVDMSASPLRASQGGGWELDARGAFGGTLRLRGRMEDVAGIARAGVPVAVMPGDFGLLQYGQFSIFFQYTSAPASPTTFLGPDPLALLAIFSSAVIHFGVLGLVRTLMTPDQLGKPFELTSPEEYAARFHLNRPPVEIPPPPSAGADKDSGGAGVKDPGAQDKKPPGGGQKMPGPEGKLGKNGKADHTELPGEVRPAQNLGGLTEVLEGDTGKEIRNTLKSIDTVASALSGLNSQNIVLGGGPGTSLKGGGAGGGGNNNGVPFGVGTMQTGWGAGNGGGYGAGAGSPGGRGNGGNGRGGAGGGGGNGNGAGSGNGNGETKVGAAAPPAASGGLTPEQIRRVVAAHLGAVRACYDIELQKNPNLKGGMQLSWQIDPSGSVTNASVVSSSLGSPRVEGCVIRQLKNWKFPEASAASNVSSYPFKFGVGG